jgi:hypothetical protein
MDWNLYSRNPDGTRQGEIDDWTAGKFTPLWCDVGSWSLTLNANSPQVAYMAQPGAGVILCRDDTPLVSGVVTDMERVQNKDENTITFSGFTDEVWLKRRNVVPSPSESSGYTVQASDDRTGVCSTVLAQYVNVNAGPGAIAPRQVPGLTIGTDLGIGANVSGSGRWQTNLLTFMQPLAVSGGIGFRIVQVGNNLEFQTYLPTDRSKTVKFSKALGNLAGVQYSITAPDGNYVYVGGSGTGTSRVIKEYSDADSIAAGWGRIEGEFVDRNDTADTTQLQQAGTDALTQNTEQMSLAITPLETKTLKFGQDYFLGDTVSVTLQDGIPNVYGTDGVIVDILRSVTINLAADDVSVTPAIGTPGRADVLRIFKSLKNFRRRLNQLERQ